MTVAFYEGRCDEASLPLATKETAAHVVTYRKFVVFARCAALAVPFFVAFLLYWTT